MSTPNQPLALRMDDVGASSKRYEVYSDAHWRIGGLRISGDWLFLKYLPGIKSWGPYRELRAGEWRVILDLLEQHSAKLTVAVTAAWAESETQLTPFPERFPVQAAVLKEGAHQGLIEIANHGLTHCVLKDNAFKPKLFAGNRRFHREFWDWLPHEVHENHIRRAQAILQDYFEIAVVTFVPPGNVFTEDTLSIAERYGLRYVSCATQPRQTDGIQLLGNEGVFPFHDRELVLGGLSWLSDTLQAQSGKEFVTISELAQGNERLA